MDTIFVSQGSENSIGLEVFLKAFSCLPICLKKYFTLVCNETVLKSSIPLLDREVIDAAVLNKKELLIFLQSQIKDAKEKDILFSIAGTIGRTTIVKKENLPANTNQAIAIIRCPWQYLNFKFIKIILDSPILFNSFSQNRRGVGMDNVSLGDIREMVFPLPPLNEQKRIVSKIEELFSKLDNVRDTLQKVKLQLVQYRQSLLKSAFEGKLTEEWRETNQGKIKPVSKLCEMIEEDSKSQVTPTNFSETEVSLPDTWCWIKLGEITDNHDGERIPVNAKNRESMKGKLS